MALYVCAAVTTTTSTTTAPSLGSSLKDSGRKNIRYFGFWPSRHIVSTLANIFFNYDFNPSPPQKGWKWPQSGEKWPILVITWYGRLHYLRFLIISYHQIEDEKIEDVLAKLYLNPFFKGWSSRKLPFYQIFKKIIIIINEVSPTQWKW